MDYKNINDYEQLYLISENDDDSQMLMFKKYKPIVISIAKKYYRCLPINYKISIDDLIQEGFIGLSGAIKTFKESANTCFYTYTVVCIERSISNFCRGFSSKKNKTLNMAFSMDTLVSLKISNQNVLFDDKSYKNDPDSYLMNDYYNYLCINFKNELSFNEALVFELRVNGFKYREIARLLDISMSGVDRIIRNIKKKYQKLVM